MGLLFALSRAGRDFSRTSTLQAGSTVSVCPPALADWALLLHGHTYIIRLTGAAGMGRAAISNWKKREAGSEKQLAISDKQLGSVTARHSGTRAAQLRDDRCSTEAKTKREHNTEIDKAYCHPSRRFWFLARGICCSSAREVESKQQIPRSATPHSFSS